LLLKLRQFQKYSFNRVGIKIKFCSNMKKLNLEQMVNVNDSGRAMVVACEGAVFAAGAAFQYVTTVVGTAICPGIGTATGWLVGAIASVAVSMDTDCVELQMAK
jgi:hypothetical protein